MSVHSSIHLAGGSRHALVRGNVGEIHDDIQDALDHGRPFVFFDIVNPSDPERGQVAVSPKHVVAIYPVS